MVSPFLSLAQGDRNYSYLGSFTIAEVLFQCLREPGWGRHPPEEMRILRKSLAWLSNLHSSSYRKGHRKTKGKVRSSTIFFGTYQHITQHLGFIILCILLIHRGISDFTCQQYTLIKSPINLLLTLVDLSKNYYSGVKSNNILLQLQISVPNFSF